MTEETMIARKEGRAGRLTFNRPKALNALDHDMAMAIEAALDQWRDDPEVDLVVIDAVGDRAFCSGGDIAAVYRAGIAGDYAPGRDFWRDEYRMNAKIAEYPKPVVAFMQGFVMGGGVGVGGQGDATGGEGGRGGGGERRRVARAEARLPKAQAASECDALRYL